MEKSLIRRPRPEDAAILAEICIRTGALGEDARLIEDDPALLPKIFLDPYLRHSPDCAWVVEDQDGVCGYAVGVADSRSFDMWLEENWWPSLRDQHRAPVGHPDEWKGSDWLRNWIHNPPTIDPFIQQNWPASGHIDLLPRAQGRGFARPLMLGLGKSLRASGAGGVHLGVAQANHRALRFYEKLGFRTVEGASDDKSTVVASGLPLVPEGS